MGRASSPLRLPVYPGLGLAGVFIGTVAAIALMPYAPQAEGALRWSALALAGGLLFAPAAAMFGNPRSIFRIEHILVLSPIYWLLLDLIQGTYPLHGIENAAIREAFILIGVFAAACWLGIAMRPFRLPKFVFRAASVQLHPQLIFRLIVLMWVLAMMKFAVPSHFSIPRMIEALGQPRWSTPWARGTLGGWDAFLEHLSYFGFVLPCLAVLLAHKIGWFSGRVAASIILSGILVLFLAQEGGRRIVGVVFGAAAIYWILLKPRLDSHTVLKFLFVMAGLLAALQFMLMYRRVGFSAFLEGRSADIVPETLRVDDNFLRLCQLVEIFPERVPFVHEKLVFFTLVRPIPRVFWPGKVTSPGYDLPTLVGERGVTLTSSCIGEFYASWGVLGIILGGVFYGALARMFSPLLAGLANPERLLIYSFSALVIFAGVRSTIELVLMSYGLLAWMAALILMARGKQ